jgi:hypothetical protein
VTGLIANLMLRDYRENVSKFRHATGAIEAGVD